MPNANNLKRPQKYFDKEVRTQEAIWEVSEEPKPNIVALARKYSVPEQGLRERWKGLQSHPRESSN